MKVSREAGSPVVRIGDVFEKTLPVQIGETEAARKAQEMAQAQVTLNRLGDIKKKWVKKIGEKMKPLEAAVRMLAPVVNNGIEERTVRVQWEAEVGGSSVVLRRLDTDEVLEETRRALKPEELQMSLGLAPSADAPELLPTKEEPLRPGAPDWRTAPPEAGRGATPCGAESVFERHDFGDADPDGWRPCRKCPVDRRDIPLAAAPAAEPKPSGGTYDFRKDPPHANRGTTLCPTEAAHVWCHPDAEGWESCKNCPAARRKVSSESDDLAESRAALEELEVQPGAGLISDEVRWPVSASPEDWQLSIRGDDLWLHSPEAAGSPAQEYGPAGWAPANEGGARIVPWAHAKNWGDVPPGVLFGAARLLEAAPEGMATPKTMDEVRAKIANERAAELREWDVTTGDVQAERATGTDAPAPEAGVPSRPLSDLAERLVLALLAGPLTLDQIRSKTTNRRPGTMVKDLIGKGLLVGRMAGDAEPGDGEPELYKLSEAGLVLATNIKSAKDSKAQRPSGGKE